MEERIYCLTDEDILSTKTGFSNGIPHLGFIPIHLGRVDVSVSSSECLENGRFGIVVLEDAKAQERNKMT